MAPIAENLCMLIAQNNLVYLSLWLSISPCHEKAALAKLGLEQCSLGLATYQSPIPSKEVGGGYSVNMLQAVRLEERAVPEPLAERPAVSGQAGPSQAGPGAQQPVLCVPL